MPPSAGRERGRKRKWSAARRDFDALRERRMRAVEMFEAGRRQVDVVVELEVSAQTASRWHKAWTESGREALVGADRVGRRPRLDDEQIAEVEAVLRRPGRSCESGWAGVGSVQRGGRSSATTKRSRGARTSGRA
ncbi:helix-turn-helix domain-containing protein [Nocardia sp. GAS34]|uniref:helix-turn-helix domain-containing protein n=1 Tax=unclassified Nocardia TaxID=2637762 RepID=UPI003D1A1F36